MSRIVIQWSRIVNVCYYAFDEEGFSDETITFVLVMGKMNSIICYACEQGICLM